MVAPKHRLSNQQSPNRYLGKLYRQPTRRCLFSQRGKSKTPKGLQSIITGTELPIRVAIHVDAMPLSEDDPDSKRSNAPHPPCSPSSITPKQKKNQKKS